MLISEKGGTALHILYIRQAAHLSMEPKQILSMISCREKDKSRKGAKEKGTGKCINAMYPQNQRIC